MTTGVGGEMFWSVSQCFVYEERFALIAMEQHICLKMACLCHQRHTF